MVATFPTGNPHTDIDFFTQGRRDVHVRRHARHGPNGGGQTILKLTNGGVVRRPSSPATPRPPARATPSARSACSTTSRRRPRAARAQHDQHRGLNKEAQLLIDASDANGRCHDGGDFGLRHRAGRPRDHRHHEPGAPKEIGLTSHIGEAHTVNIDPKRPHIAYAVTSDSVSVDANGTRAQRGRRRRRGAEPRRLRGRRPVLVHELPRGHDARRQARRAAGRRSTATAIRARASRSATRCATTSTRVTRSRSTPPTCSRARAATRRSCST